MNDGVLSKDSNYLFEIDKKNKNNYINLQDDMDKYLFEIFTKDLLKNKNMCIHLYNKNNLYVCDLNDYKYINYNIIKSNCVICNYDYYIIVEKTYNLMINDVNNKVEYNKRSLKIKKYKLDYYSCYELEKISFLNIRNTYTECKKHLNIKNYEPKTYDKYFKNYNFSKYFFYKKRIEKEIEYNGIIYSVIEKIYQNDNIIIKKDIDDCNFLKIKNISEDKEKESINIDEYNIVIEKIKSNAEIRSIEEKKLIEKYMETQIEKYKDSKKAYKLFKKLLECKNKIPIVGEFYTSNYLKDKNSILNIDLFSKNKISAYESDMGTAKTSMVVTYFNEYLKKLTYDEETGIILIITCRRTHSKSSREYYNKLTDTFFHHYQDENIKYNEKCLVIEYESLHKLKCLNYKCVVIDEGFQLFNNISSELTNIKNDTKLTNHIKHVFKSVLVNTDKIIYLDSNIAEHHIEHIKNLSEYKKCNVFYNKIDYSKLKNKKRGDLVCYDSFGNIMKKLKKALKNDKRVCLILNNVKKLKKIQKDDFFKKYNPEIVISENSNDFFDKFKNSDINQYFIDNPQIKLFCYTNTISVGVNIDCKNVFDNIFLIATTDYGNICDTLQSAFRIRNPNSKKIHFYCDQKKSENNYHYDYYEDLFIDYLCKNKNYYGKLVKENVISQNEYTKTEFYSLINSIDNIKYNKFDGKCDNSKIPCDIKNKIFNLKYLPNIYKSYGRSILIFMFKKLGYEVIFRGNVLPYNFRKNEMKMVFGNVWDETELKYYDYGVKKNVENLYVQYESIVKTVSFFYEDEIIEEINMDIIEKYKNILKSNEDKKLYFNISIRYEDLELEKKLRYTEYFFKKKINKIELTDKIIGMYNYAYNFYGKNIEIDSQKVVDIDKYFDYVNKLGEYNMILLNKQLIIHRMNSNNEEIAMYTKKIISYDSVWKGSNFKSNISITYASISVIDNYYYYIENIPHMNKYNGLFIADSIFMEQCFDFIKHLCEVLVGIPKKDEILKYIDNNEYILLYNNMFNLIAEDQRILSFSDKETESICLCEKRVMILITWSNNYDEFLNNLELYKNKMRSYLNEHFISAKEEIKRITIDMNENRNVNKNKIKKLIKNEENNMIKLEEKISFLDKHICNTQCIKKIIKCINIEILNKCGYAFSSRIKNDKGNNKVNKKKENGKRISYSIFRIGEKNMKSIPSFNN